MPDTIKYPDVSNSSFNCLISLYACPLETPSSFATSLALLKIYFFGFTVKRDEDISINTFSDIMKVIMEIKNAGIPVECTTSVNTDTRRLEASINIESPQVASLISRWNELNNELQSDKIDTDEYNIWIDSMMNSFNIPIENY